MFTINNEILQMNRGDDIDFTFVINSGTPLLPVINTLEPIIFHEGTENEYIENECLYFGVMESNQKWEDSIIRKKLTPADIDENGNVHLHLYPEDTEDLAPGTYWYMIKVYIYDRELNKMVINTICNRTKFIIW